VLKSKQRLGDKIKDKISGCLHDNLRMNSYNTRSQLYTVDYRIKAKKDKIGPTARRMKENNENKECTEIPGIAAHCARESHSLRIQKEVPCHISKAQTNNEDTSRVERLCWSQARDQPFLIQEAADWHFPQFIFLTLQPHLVLLL